MQERLHSTQTKSRPLFLQVATTEASNADKIQDDNLPLFLQVATAEASPTQTLKKYFKT